MVFKSQVIPDSDELQMKFKSSLFTSLLDVIDDCIIIIDLNGHIEYWNKGAEKIFGYTVEEVLGKRNSFLYPDNQEQNLDKDLELILLGSRRISNWKGKRKNGQIVYLNVNVSPIHDESAKPVGFIGVSRDVTKEVADAQELLLIKTAVNNAADMIAIGDMDGKTVFVNKALEPLGYNIENSPFFPFGFIHEEDPQNVLRAIIEDGQFRGEVEIKDKKGEHFEVDLKANLAFNDLNNPIGIIGVSTDLREYKKINKQLQDYSLQQSALAELGHYALEYSDITQLSLKTLNKIDSLLNVKDSHIFQLHYDKKVFREIASSIDEYIGKEVPASQEYFPGYTLFNEEPVVLNEQLILKFEKCPIIGNRKNISGISMVIRGAERAYGILIIVGEEGRIYSDDEVNFLKAVTNILGSAIQQSQITQELKLLNEKLEERVRNRTQSLEFANKTLEIFNFSVSHDLQAPLRSIDMFTQLMGKSLPADDIKNQDYLNFVRKSCFEMRQLLNDLLIFTKLDKKEKDFTEVDLEKVFKQVFEDLSRDLTDREIQFDLNPIPNVPADSTMLKQVVMNLLSNALKYTNNRTPALIEIGFIPDDKDVVIYVKDNGEGFDMKYTDLLFQPFQRFHSRNQYEGSGIGLAIVERIIQRHGGSVWAESKLNEGATFYFSLPKETLEFTGSSSSRYLQQNNLPSA